MNKTQPRSSELQGGWPSKKMMAARSGEVFSLDFLFIEQEHPAEAAVAVRMKQSAPLAAPLMRAVRRSPLIQSSIAELACSLYRMTAVR
jgi:hypothetical protein